MRPFYSLPKMLAAACLLAACASPQKANVALDEARDQYKTAQADPQVFALAPAELQRGGEALNNANAAW